MAIDRACASPAGTQESRHAAAHIGERPQRLPATDPDVRETAAERGLERRPSGLVGDLSTGGQRWARCPRRRRPAERRQPADSSATGSAPASPSLSLEFLEPSTARNTSRSPCWCTTTCWSRAAPTDPSPGSPTSGPARRSRRWSTTARSSATPHRPCRRRAPLGSISASPDAMSDRDRSAAGSRSAVEIVQGCQRSVCRLLQRLQLLAQLRRGGRQVA